MKIRLKPTIYNNDRLRKQALKEVRKPIQDSPLTKTKKKLFKVKRIKNSDLYGDENTQGEHLVLSVAINPQNDDVATATLTSLEDKEGHPTKQEKVKQGLIMALPEDKISNFSRRVGIQQEVITKNATTGIKLNYSMLEEPLYGAKIDNSLKKEIDKFLFNNPEHKRNSAKNYNKVKKYIKIK